MKKQTCTSLAIQAQKILNDLTPVFNKMTQGYRYYARTPEFKVINNIRLEIFGNDLTDNSTPTNNDIIASTIPLSYEQFMKETLTSQIELFKEWNYKILQNIASGKSVYCIMDELRKINYIDERIFIADRTGVKLEDINLISEQRYTPWSTIQDAAPYLRHFFRRKDENNLVFLLNYVQNDCLYFGMDPAAYAVGTTLHPFPLGVCVSDMELWEHAENFNGPWVGCWSKYRKYSKDIIKKKK